MTDWPPGTFMSRIGCHAAERLLCLAEPRYLAANRILISQGDDSEQVMLLGPPAEGETSDAACAKVTSVLRNGTEAMFGIRLRGDLVGELSMFRDAPAVATVTSCAPLSVRVFSHSVFESFLTEHPEAWRALMAMLAERLEWSDRHRAEFVGYEVEARLARVLVDLAERHGVPTREGTALGVRLSHTDLGKLIGARTDAVGNAIRRFRSEGLLVSGYRHVVIVDMERLNGVYENA
ncbi:Crp/Fnr family transcriptional regulator [Nocardiopsis alkaliphila]|uniref:Crp/Fnr family transcriptional regulator n=1 Tax=Nocardiopsis alkaliphila TaxID=225762 RepID=UPI000366CDF7|nr:Crp/Fnr family transcriptional regulator [Nocardiopsis alkaliphila]